MTIYWIYLLVGLVAAGLALAITPIVKSIALKFKQVDAPSARKVHEKPMVRLGGVAIFGATLLPFLGCWLTGVIGHFTHETHTTVLALLLGGSGFFLVGFADDLFELSAFNRLWLQSLIAVGIWSLGIRIDTLVFPGLEPFSLGWLSLPVTVFWVTGVVNAINWIDGLDGLAAGVSGITAAVFVGLGIIWLQPVLALIGAALLGSLLGFLYYNYNPATIFMGDGGAYFIGFMLASLCIVGPQYFESPFATVLPLVILAVPLGDMTGVILARLYRRQSPFNADNLHFHHRLLQRDISHKGTVWIVYVLTMASSCLALALVGVGHRWMPAIGALGLLWTVVWKMRQFSAPIIEPSNVFSRKGLWYSKNL